MKPQDQKAKEKLEKGAEGKRGGEMGIQAFSSPPTYAPARRRGWASVLRTKWSRWRREGSEKVRYRYFSVSANQKLCFRQRLLLGSCVVGRRALMGWKRWWKVGVGFGVGILWQRGHVVQGYAIERDGKGWALTSM